MARLLSLLVLPLTEAQHDLTRKKGIARLGCTALAIDGGATTTGSAFAVENTDCDSCDFRLTYVAPRTRDASSRRAVYSNSNSYPRWVGYGRSHIYHPKPGQSPKQPISFIDEVESTYGYWESISPLMNDQGLGLGESSVAANLQNKWLGSTENRTAPSGVLDAMTLMQLALERCATSLCAVETMGALSERYGYLPYNGEPMQGVDPDEGRTIWADSGEAYTIADASGEAWVFNVLGGVEGIIKSVWAAQRVPRGHVAIVANEFTMGELPVEPNDDFKFPPAIRAAARAAGLWQGEDNDPLHFTKTFAPDPVLYTTTAQPIPLYTSLRRWGLFNLIAPSLKLQFNIDHRTYPFSVQAESKLTHRDVMDFMKYHYQGTEFDMAQGVLAGPYSTPFRIEGTPGIMGDVPRGISILRTLYSTITQTGPEGSTLWYSADAPLTGVYVPIDRHSKEVSVAYEVGHMQEFSRDSAWWAFNLVNNWMQLDYKGMSTKYVYPHIKRWQDRIDKEVVEAHVNGSDLTQWQVRLQEQLVADWWILADFLFMKWNDMNIVDGFPEFWTQMIGFSNDVHPIWVQPAEQPRHHVDGYVPPTVSLPRDWHWTNKTAHEGEWRNLSQFPSTTVFSSELASAKPAGMALSLSQALVLAFAMFGLGGVAGASAMYGMVRRQQQHQSFEPLLG